MIVSTCMIDRDVELSRSLATEMHGTIGTAVHALIAAAHLGAFREGPDQAPLSRMSRLALTAFTSTMLVYQIAITRGTHTNPPTARFQYALQANNYTAPTRNAPLAALPCLATCYHVKAKNAKARTDAYPIVPSTCSSQESESALAEFSGPSSLQTTSSVYCGDISRHISKINITQDDEAKGILHIPKSRKAGNHVLHDLHHSGWAVSV